MNRKMVLLLIECRRCQFSFIVLEISRNLMKSRSLFDCFFGRLFRGLSSEESDRSFAVMSTGFNVSTLPLVVVSTEIDVAESGDGARSVPLSTMMVSESRFSGYPLSILVCKCTKKTKTSVVLNSMVPYWEGDYVWI